MVSLPTSGIQEISLWIILLVALVGGFFSGFLGGGAGYIRMPSMVYVLGIPTHLAVGTDLFEIVISASYGTFTHAIKGNVDILIALVMHTGAVIGAQIGVVATQYFAGPKIRLAFVPLPLIGVAHRYLHARHRPQIVAMKILICSDGTSSAETATHLGGLLAGPLNSRDHAAWESRKRSEDEQSLRDALNTQAQSLRQRGVSPDISRAIG